MGNKKRSEQSSVDASDYADGTESTPDAQRELAAESDGYPEGVSVDEALEDTPLEGRVSELSPGPGADPVALSEAASKADFEDAPFDPDEIDSPPPAPSEAAAFRSVENTPVIGHSGMVSEDFEDDYGDSEIVLKQAQQMTTGAVKQHLKSIRDDEVRSETAARLGAIVAYIPPGDGDSGASQDTGGMFTPTSRLGGEEGIMLVSPGDSPEETEKVVKHEMLHGTLDAYGIHAKDNAADRYDSDSDEPVKVDDLDRYRFDKFNDKEAPEDLVAVSDAAENAWERMQQAPREEFDRVAIDPSRSNSGYASVSPEETLTQFHEVMQEDEAITPKLNWFYEHGDTTRAYTKTFEPSEKKQGAISHLHERDPEASPFEENPYPDADLDEDTKTGLDLHADAREE